MYEDNTMHNSLKKKNLPSKHLPTYIAAEKLQDMYNALSERGCTQRKLLRLTDLC